MHGPRHQRPLIWGARDPLPAPYDADAGSGLGPCHTRMELWPLGCVVVTRPGGLHPSGRLQLCQVLERPGQCWRPLDTPRSLRTRRHDARGPWGGEAVSRRQAGLAPEEAVPAPWLGRRGGAAAGPLSKGLARFVTGIKSRRFNRGCVNRNTFITKKQNEETKTNSHCIELQYGSR